MEGLSLTCDFWKVMTQSLHYLEAPLQLAFLAQGCPGQRHLAKTDNPISTVNKAKRLLYTEWKILHIGSRSMRWEDEDRNLGGHTVGCARGSGIRKHVPRDWRIPGSCAGEKQGSSWRANQLAGQTFLGGVLLFLHPDPWLPGFLRPCFSQQQRENLSRTRRSMFSLSLRASISLDSA